MDNARCAPPSNLHVHHIRIGLHQPVAHMQRGLEADLRLLHGNHGFFQAHGRVFQLHFALQPARVFLRGAHGLERALEGLGEAACDLTRGGGRCGNAAGQVGAGEGGNRGIDAQVHDKSQGSL